MVCGHPEIVGDVERWMVVAIQYRSERPVMMTGTLNFSFESSSFLAPNPEFSDLLCPCSVSAGN